MADAVVCACGLYLHRGTWHAGHPPLVELHEGTCPACARARGGKGVSALRIPTRLLDRLDEIVHLIQNCERRERAEHPLERLIGIQRDQGGLSVTTTGPHLARRIAHGLARQFHERPRLRPAAGRDELRIDWNE